MNNLDALMTSARTGELERDEWRTPLWFYNLLNSEFDFDLDPAATDENALCDYYFTKEDNGLKQQWWGNVFVNPPYSQIKLWAEKGYEEAEKGNANVVMLTAARTDTIAWWSWLRFGEVRFIKGRINFIGGKSSAPFPSAVVIFRKNLYQPGTVYWEIEKPKVKKPK